MRNSLFSNSCLWLRLQWRRSSSVREFRNRLAQKASWCARNRRIYGSDFSDADHRNHLNQLKSRTLDEREFIESLWEELEDYRPSLYDSKVLVGDRIAAALSGRPFVSCAHAITPGVADREPSGRTEWVLLTSGTTGVPKLVRHTFATLTGAMTTGCALGVWSTFYDMRRYGGLQIFLRAMLGGGSMVLSSTSEPIGAFLARAVHTASLTSKVRRRICGAR